MHLYQSSPAPDNHVLSHLSIIQYHNLRLTLKGARKRLNKKRLDECPPGAAALAVGGEGLGGPPGGLCGGGGLAGGALGRWGGCRLCCCRNKRSKQAVRKVARNEL